MLITDLVDYRVKERINDLLLERLHQALDLPVDLLGRCQVECCRRQLLLGKHVLEGLHCQAYIVLLFCLGGCFLITLLLLFLIHFMGTAGPRETASAFGFRRLSDEVSYLWHRLCNGLFLNDTHVLTGREEGAKVLHLHYLVEESNEVAKQCLTILSFTQLRPRFVLRNCLVNCTVLLWTHY